jgi:POT family proton-dependent oligopeptide transporter
MPNTTSSIDSRLGDAKQLGLWSAIASLGYIFWVVGGMEMVERLAYYGVRSVTGLYVTNPVSKGGLGITIADLGSIFLIWALVQSLVPVMGGLADRWGYKETIFLSTVIKIAAYLTMGFFPSYWGFVIGAMLLALGTGIFKPGIQGTLAKVTNETNSSMAWGIFYQTVNIGGWMGPLLAAQLRQLDWSNLFFACAGIISINFILLLTYKEPNREERLAHRQKVKSGEVKEESLIKESLAEMLRPHVFFFLLLMSGFWFMFNALFDVLPLHIRDWVDTSTIITGLFGNGETPGSTFRFLLGMNQAGTHIMPEGLLNVNAGMIMLTCFLFAYLSGKLPSINSMVLGTLLCGLSFAMMGYTAAGWIVLFAIMIFSAGEMFSSPKSLEIISNFAPSDKKAMYLGFANLPSAIGWMLESYIAPMLYGKYGAKETLSREMLGSEGLSAQQLENIPYGEAFTYLVQFSGKTPEMMTSILYAQNNVGYVWYIMSLVAVLSAIGLVFYGMWMKKLLART